MTRPNRRWGGDETRCEIGLILDALPETDAVALLAVGVHLGSYALQRALHEAGHPQVSRQQCRQHLTTPDRSATACRCARPYPVSVPPKSAFAQPAPAPMRRRNPICGVAMLRRRISADDCMVLDAMVAEWPVTEAHAALVDWLGADCDLSYAVLNAHAAGRCRCPRLAEVAS